ncbi:MAG: rhomboid family intramembrane serine protease [Puniceicoccaceae bacterium]|nr:MAG: rhomboid family intramembrane serine protease [Puniceicoccaceae bacterium]
MLGLYFIGRVIEPILGSRTFLYLYLASGIVGALLYLSFHFDPTSLGGGLVGASAAVSGILAFFCLIKPEERITLLLFFVFPISLKPKWLLRAYAAISLGLLFTEELYGSGNIAHSAHLGGLLAGFLFYQFFYRDRHSLFQSFQEPSIELPTWFKKQKKRDSNARYSVNYSDSNTQLKSEVNRILDKINLHGFASLSEEEKSTLEKAKALFNR